MLRLVDRPDGNRSISLPRQSAIRFEVERLSPSQTFMKNSSRGKRATKKPACHFPLSDDPSSCGGASTEKICQGAEPTEATESESQNLDDALSKAIAILDMVCPKDEEEKRLKIASQYALIYVRRAAQCHAIPGLDSAIWWLERGLKDVGNALVPKANSQNNPVG
jgi:hypothetical protein